MKQCIRITRSLMGLAFLLALCLLLCGHALAEDFPESLHPYANNSDQTWTYTHPTSAQYLQLVFSADTKVEANYDFIYITDSSGSQQKYSGTALSGKTLYLPGNSFTIRLTSDSSQNYYGFSITSIEACAKGNCGTGASWVFNEVTGALSITGSGAMTDYYYYEREDRYDDPSHYTYPWRSYTAAIRSISVGEGITSVGDCAFANLYNASLCTLPSTLKSIGESAFKSCGVTELKLPSALTAIGECAFWNSKISTINLPSGITAIPNSAFEGCGITSIDLPSNLTDIGDFAFYRSSLASVTLPNGLKRIGNSAFAGTKLTAVKLPGGLEHLGSSAFPADAQITYPSTIPHGTENGIQWSVVGGVLRLSGTGDMPDYAWLSPASGTPYCTAPWYAYRSAISSIVVENGVTSLGAHAFYDLNISSVTLPNTLKTIADGALMCNGLASVTVPSGVTSVGNAFRAETQVIGMRAGGTDGGTVWRIENGALHVSGSLPDYPLIEGSADTPWHIHENSITSIVVASGVSAIGSNAFYNCFNAASVSIPETVVSIGRDAFHKCSSVTRVDYRATSMSSWPLISFENCYANPMAYSGKAQLCLNGYPSAGIAALQGDVSAYAFYNCTNSFTVAASGGKISSVGDYAFYNCTGLTEAGMPSSLTHVGKAAFKNCTSLSYTFCLFDGLTYIGDEAFKGCTALTGVDMKVYRDAEIEYFGNNAFNGCTAMRSIELGRCEVLPYATFYLCSALESVTLPSELTEIQNTVFYGCTSLKTIGLPSSLEKIGVYAFYDCSGLGSIAFPKKVKAIGEGAFKGCAALSGISFQGSAPEACGSMSFSGVTANVRYRPGISWADKRQNYGGKLTWLPLGGSCGDAQWLLSEDGLLIISGSGTVQAGAWSAYSGDIFRILIGDGVSAIGSRAFADLAQVSEIALAGSTTQIAADAFVGVSADVYWVESRADMREMCEAFDAPYAEGFGGTLDWRHPLCSISLDSESYALVRQAHDLSRQAANEPDCLAPGNAEYWSCTRCSLCFADELAQQPAQEDSLVLPALGHSYAAPQFNWSADASACEAAFACTRCDDVQTLAATISSRRVKEPDCANRGETEYSAAVEFGTEEIPNPENPDETILAPRVYTDTLTLADIPTLAHTKVTISGIAPTCTEPGTKDYIFCEVCGTVLQESDELPALGHSENITVEALEPSCTEPGRTQEIVCSVCGELLSASKPIEATGHSESITVEALEPSCTEPGRTREIVCSVCGELLSASQPITALGHTPATDPAVPPTDHESGLTEGSHCTVCGETLSEQTVVPANFSWEGNTAVAYNGSAVDVVIPDDATALGNALFKYNTDIRTVRVPDSVTSLGTQSFFGCTSLTDVWLPQGLTDIGAQTFYSVTARIHADADSATAVALSFRGVPFVTGDGLKLRYRVTSATGQPTAAWLIACTRDAESIVLPETVGAVPLTQIQSGAFAACGSLKEVWIPESVTVIAGDAFDGQTEALVIRSAIHAYARNWAADKGYVWAHDRHVQEVLPGVPPTCTEDGLTDGLRCSECGEILLEQQIDRAKGHSAVVDAALPPTYVTSGLTEGSHCAVCGLVLQEQSVVPMVEKPPMLALPQALREIEAEAFAGDSFVCVALPEGCRRIGDGAFRDCAQLRYVEIPESVTDIADTAFDGCGEQLIIITTPGSAAESFAQAHGIICALK